MAPPCFQASFPTHLAPQGDHAAARFEVGVAEPDLRRGALLPPRRHELLHALVVEVAHLHQGSKGQIKVSVVLQSSSSNFNDTKIW